MSEASVDGVLHDVGFPYKELPRSTMENSEDLGVFEGVYNPSHESDGRDRTVNGSSKLEETGCPSGKGNRCWLETCLKPAHGKPNWVSNFINYEERLGSTCPTVEDCNGDTIRHYVHEGICIQPLANLAQSIPDGMHFNVTDDDIWLASYIRSGKFVLYTIDMEWHYKITLVIGSVGPPIHPSYCPAVCHA